MGPAGATNVTGKEVTLFRTALLREALPERHEQLERPFEPNLPAQQRPHHALFLLQKADPRLRVGGDVQIRLADVPVRYGQFPVPYYDRRLTRFVAGEGEVEGGAQAGRLARLEDVWRALEKDLDAAGPQAVTDVPEPLVREPLGGVFLGIGVLHDV